MKELRLSVEDSVYDKFIDFVRILPQDQVRVIEGEVPGSRMKRRFFSDDAGLKHSDLLYFSEFWESVGS